MTKAADKPHLILASGSPRRQALLTSLGVNFRVMPSNADETVEGPVTAVELVERLALRKAVEVAKRAADENADQMVNTVATLVIGADTVVVRDGEILGKPSNEEDAKRMLGQLQGRTHQVYTGVCVLPATHQAAKLVRHSCTEVTMRPLSEAEIAAYVATGEPMDKAGSYGIQELGSLFVTRIEGDYFNVVGLPLVLLDEMLRAIGYNILAR